MGKVKVADIIRSLSKIKRKIIIIDNCLEDIHHEYKLKNTNARFSDQDIRWLIMKNIGPAVKLISFAAVLSTVNRNRRLKTSIYRIKIFRLKATAVKIFIEKNKHILFCRNICYKYYQSGHIGKLCWVI